jgi:CSLREA domain-containing protein
MILIDSFIYNAIKHTCDYLANRPGAASSGTSGRMAGRIVPHSIYISTVILLLLTFSTNSFGASYTVPGDYATISAAITAASSSDTITVSAGTWNENIDFGGKNITIQSASGAASTFIRGTTGYNNNPVVKFVSGETSSAVLDGFTIDNNTSNASDTRGITITDSSPTIQNCIIENNEAYYATPGYGAGIKITGTGGATIIDTIIRNNTTGTSGEKAGGIYHTGSGLLSITGGSIESNFAYKGGGGIVGTSGDITLDGVTVKLNTSGTGAVVGGGGIHYSGGGTLTIQNNSSIESNTANKGGGGGIYLSASTLNITNSTIKSNICSGDSGGGGILVEGASTVTISKTKILGNRANGTNNNSDAGGIKISAGTATITSTVVAGNTADNAYWAEGGGIYNAGTLNLYFSTVTDNYSDNQGGGIYGGGTENIYNSIVWGNSANVGADEISGTTENLYLTETSSDPTFASRAPATDSNPTTTGQYDLQSGSNCIDTGDSTNAPADDIVGNSRNQGSGYDKGAYEFVVAAGNNAPFGGYTADNVIPTAQVTQSSNGDAVITINFRAKDADGDTVTLNTFEYSIDGGSTWNAPTGGDSSGSLSANWEDGGSSYSTATDWTGTVHNFTFDTDHADVSGISGTDQSDIKIRFTVNDATDDSAAPATSEDFQVDDVAPTDTITSAEYSASTDTLIITGTNFTTIAAASTDIKSYVDWTKFVWDINGDDAVTTDITFVEGDITSLTVTDATTLTLVFTGAKGTAIEATSGYGSAGGADTLDVAAGFSKDAAGNAAATDAVADGTLSIPLPSFDVTKEADTDDGSCDVSDCSLREAIKAANDSSGHEQINVPSGTYTITLSGTDDTNALGDFDITDDVTIVGAGSGSTTIRAGTSVGTAIDRIFHVTNSSAVTIEGVTIQYGKVSGTGGCVNAAGDITIKDSVVDSCQATNNHGGAIYSDGAVTLDNTTVSNGNAGNNGGGVYTNGMTIINGATFENNYSTNKGAGIYNNGTANTITGSGTITFTNNDTQKSTNDYGGAIYSDGNITFTGTSSFTSNDATYGAGIFIGNSASTVVLGTTTFDSNNTSTHGGGMYTYGVQINGDATFTDNYSTGAGAGIYSLGANPVHITGTATFTNNDTQKSTSDRGGGIWSEGNVIIDGVSNFSDNDAEYGGAIYLNDSTRTITLNSNATFDNNTVPVHGGALYTYGLTVDGNLTLSNNAVSGAGAGIYSLGPNDIHVTGNAIFTNNDTPQSTGDRGGAIYSAGGDLIIDGSATATGNQAEYGGVIYLDAGSTTISGGASFTFNNSAVHGGAIYTNGLTITGGATFQDNTTSSGESAIYSAGANAVSIDGDIDFSRNAGGGIKSVGGDVTLNPTTGTSLFDQNTGADSGGAIYAGGNVSVSTPTVTDNTATAGSGGAIYAAGSTSITGNASFSGNTTTGHGGAIYTSGLSITGNATFEDNYSTNTGGAIRNNGTANVVAISGTGTFTNNDTQKSTSDDGGAIWSDGNVTVSGNANFTNNDALAGGAIFLNASTATISFGADATLNTNTCTNNGGALYTYGLDVTGDLSMTGNSSGGAGGGVYSLGGNNITIGGDATFTNNDTGLSTDDNGGAIYSASGNLSITGSVTADDNDAWNGGTIFLNSGSTTISGGASFINGDTGIHGAAIYTNGLTISGGTGATFTDNTTGSGEGAIYSAGANTVSIDGDIDFSRNSGGGIKSVSGDVTLNPTSGTSLFDQNTNADAGGAIYAGGNVSVKTPTFSSNTATSSGSGGAIYAGGSTTITGNASFTSNTAQGHGGAVYTSGLTITGNATFEDNYSTNTGGAIRNNGTANEVAISGTGTFTNNDTQKSTSDDGGAIWSEGNVTVSGTANFTNNDALGGGAIYLGASTATISFGADAILNTNTCTNNGGALFTYGLDVTGDLSMTGNSSGGAGGGVYSLGSNNITIGGDAIFTNNDTGLSTNDNGGAIYSASGNLSITGSVTADDNDALNGGTIFLGGGSTTISGGASFINGDVGGRGGAIYTYGLTISGGMGATFTDNYATDDGGAIFSAGSNPVSIDGTVSFDNNDTSASADHNGGAIYAEGDLTLNPTSGSSTFQNSDAYHGGAIYLDGASITATRGITFDTNTATSTGGAIRISGGTLTDATFSNNHVTGDDGGAIHNSTNLLTINGSSNTFSNNYSGNGAGDQGGVIYSTGPLTISNADFTARIDLVNSAYEGGAIFVNDTGDVLTLDNVTFDDFKAGNVGGAIRMYGGTLTNITITDCDVPNDGGAIFNSGAALTINGTSNTFTNNDGGTGSGDQGGAIYTSSSLSVSGTTFTNNDAYEGGAIFITDLQTLTITDSEFDTNTAANVGGAIRSYGATIDTSTFVNNSVSGGGNDGGALYSSKSITVSNSTFSANSVTDRGGAIWLSGNSTIVNTTFYNNSAGTGEAIYNNSGTTTVENSIVAKSTASSSLCYNITSSDYNLQYNGTCFTAQAHDLSADPLLKSLADNGGPTRTHALKSLSPARDAANNTTCAAAPVNNLDQRGTSRPIDSDPVAGAICDMGAYEAPAYVVPYFSGSIYSDEGTTKITASTTVNLIINGVSAGSDTTSTGDYTIIPAGFSSGDKILVYIDNDGTNDGNTVTVSDGDTLTGLDIYKDRVIVRQDNDGSLTNADMAGAWISDAGDILYSVDGSNNLTVTGTELFVWSGDTFAPSATVTAVDMDINGTLNSAANAINVSGNWDATGGVFTSTGTVTFNGTSGTNTITPGGTDAAHDFQNIAFNDSAGTATYQLGGALDVDGTLTITDGIFETTGSNYAVTVGGDFTQSGGQINGNGSTFTVGGNFTAEGTDDSTGFNNATLVINGTGSIDYQNLGSWWTNGFNNLTAGQGGGTTTMYNWLTVKDTLTIGSGELTGNVTLALTKAGDVLAFDAASNLSIDTLMFLNFGGSQNIPTLTNGYDCDISIAGDTQTVTQTGNVTINSGKNLLVKGDGQTGRSETYNTAGFDLNVGDNIVIGQGGDTALKTLNGTNSAITVGGDFTVTAVGGGSTQATFTSTGSTVTLNGTADQTITSSGSSFDNLTLNNTGADGSDDIVIADALDINGTLTITNGDLDIGTNDPTVNAAGTVAIGADGSIDVTGRTADWTFDGASTLTDSSSGGPQDLEDVVVNGTGLTLGSNTKVQTMTVTSGTLDLGSSDYILEIDGTGTPLSNSGTFTAGSSTVKYTGTGSATDIATVPYDNLELVPTAATTYSLTGHLSGANAMTGNLTVAVDATLDTTGSNFNLTVGGNLIQSSTSSQIEANSSTITVAGDFTADGTVDSTNYNNASVILTGTGNLVYNNLSSYWSNGFNNLTAGQSGNTTTISGSPDNLGIRNTLTVGSGTVTGAGQIYFVNGPNPLSFDADSTLSVAEINFHGTTHNIPPLANGYDCNVELSGPDTTVTQTGDIVINGSHILGIYGDTFVDRIQTYNTDGHALTVGGDIIIGAGDDTALKTLNGTNSTITVGGDLTLTDVGSGTTQATFTTTGSTVILNGTGQNINGSITFNNLTKTVAAADTLTFEAGETTTINGTVTLNGADSQLLTLASSTGSSAWNFVVNAGATKDIDYVAVFWSDASGSDATQKPINPTNSTDGGNNTDWFATNSAPVGGYTADNVIPAAQISQSTDGDGIITINFRAKDADTDNVTLKTFEYSVDDGSTWNAPTNGDASESLSTNWTDSDGGGTGYTSATDWSGTVHSFTFDTKHADVSGMDGVDQSDVQIRFTLNDGTDDSASPVTSESFQVDNVAPTDTITSASYDPSTDTLTITGTNFDTIAAVSTDIKSYVDWTNFAWDINGDGATTADITFVVGDVTSLTVTDATTLTLVFTAAKGTAIEATSDYGSNGGSDTLDVTAGFSKDAAGNAATTDEVEDVLLSIPGPVITVTKLSSVISDPINGGTNPKRIPGAVVEYSIMPSNTGDGAPDADSTYVIDIIDTNSVEYDATTGVSFTDGSTSSALALDAVTFSDDAAPGPYTYDYTPVPDGDGYDANVTSIKITTTGTFAFGGTPAPSFTLKYRARVK